MTITQAATRLNLSTARVRQLVAQGRLHAVKHGPLWWIMEPEVTRFAAVDRPTGRPQAVKSKPDEDWLDDWNYVGSRHHY